MAVKERRRKSPQNQRSRKDQATIAAEAQQSRLHYTEVWIIEKYMIPMVVEAPGDADPDDVKEAVADALDAADELQLTIADLYEHEVKCELDESAGTPDRKWADMTLTRDAEGDLVASEQPDWIVASGQ